MILARNSNHKITLSGVQKMILPFTPVCDIAEDIELPHVRGSRIIEVDFTAIETEGLEAEEKTAGT